MQNLPWHLCTITRIIHISRGNNSSNIADNAAPVCNVSGFIVIFEPFWICMDNHVPPYKAAMNCAGFLYTNNCGPGDTKTDKNVLQCKYTALSNRRCVRALRETMLCTNMTSPNVPSTLLLISSDKSPW